MAFTVQMPALGESVTEGTVTRWLKQEGDRVEVDEPLLEVSTDKVDTEIPSPVAGTLQEIKVEEDETVEVGAELAIIGDGPASSDSDEPEQKSEDKAAEKEEPEAEEEPADRVLGTLERQQRADGEERHRDREQIGRVERPRAQQPAAHQRRHGQRHGDPHQPAPHRSLLSQTETWAGWTVSRTTPRRSADSVSRSSSSRSRAPNASSVQTAS